MTAELRISDDLSLPLDLVTEATAIVATRGAGKSSTGAVLVEEAIESDVPVVVIDWTGVFWGLRSSTSGQQGGLAIYVLGGPHGDAPLEHTAGGLIADLVVDSGHSFVLDLSDFTKTQMRRFCADFLERLYERKARNRTTLLLLIDEAHELAPQSPRGGFKGDAARLIGAMEQVAALGRSRGIGVVMITQRTQALNKAVLDLIETLLVMRMLSPRAVAAVREWIGTKNEDDEQGVLASLPHLKTGTAWVWSPLRGILQKIAVRRIHTFDSYATPKPGEVRVEPTARRELDLDQLGEQMAATVERAKADDPAELRRRIAQLQRDLDDERAKPQPEPVVERVEVPVLAPEIVDQLEAALEPAAALLGEAQETLTKHLMWAEQQLATTRTPQTPLPSRRASSAASPTRPDSRPATRTPPGSTPPAGQGTTADLSKAQRKILTVLAQQGTRSTTQVAILTGYSHKSGGYRNALSSLRTSGYIEGRGDIDITAAGTVALGDWDALPVGRDLLDWWKTEHLSKAERAIVDVLDSHGGGPVDVATIAEHAGYSASSGGFRNALSRLRSLEIASGRGELTLNPELV